MVIENFPVGIALDLGKPEPFLAYLIDLPGIAMQGKTAVEAGEKLRVLVPTVLASYNKKGIALPTPSQEPSLTIGEVSSLMTTSAEVKSPRVGEHLKLAGSTN